MDPNIGQNERNESHLERCDRNLGELLQEVRVAQTGVQILFAFLLGLAFTSRFGQATELQRVDYFVTLISSGFAAMLLIAPTSQHRLLFRRGDKEHLVAVANRLVIAGLASVAISLIGAVLLVSDLLFGTAVAVGTSAVAAGCCVITWYGMPLARRRSLTRASGADAPAAIGRPGADVAARKTRRSAPVPTAPPS